MGQTNVAKEPPRNYSTEAQIQYQFSLDKLHGGGGKVKLEILERVYRELDLDYRAQVAMNQFMQFSLFQGQAVKIWSIDESLACPPEEPDRDESPWLEAQWRRHGNIWLLHLIEKLGIDEPTGKIIVANVAVVAKVAGGPMRVTLMEVDDYLSDRPNCISQADLHQLVRAAQIPGSREMLAGIFHRHGRQHFRLVPG